MSRGLVAGLLVCLASVALVACTTAPSDPEPSSTTLPTPQQSPPEPTGVEPVAVVSIAAVDVDGLNLTVAGFVTQIREDGEPCRFVLTSGISGGEVTAETTGVANVDSTSCGTTQVPVSQLSRGPWEVVLEYGADDATLESEPVPVEVP